MATVEERVAEIRELIRATRAAIVEYEADIVTMEADIELLLNPPLAPDPLPASVAHHGEQIPVPGNLGVHVAKTGIWSNPATWSTGKVPTATDRVRIQAGMFVMIDEACECDVLVVDGELLVAALMETTLTVTTLFGMPGGKFSGGTPQNITTGAFTCLFRPAAPDPADPQKYWNGIVWLGEFVVHGEPKSAYAELVEDIA